MYRIYLSVALIGLLFVSVEISDALMEDIVAAWTFDEGGGTIVRDISGNGNDGEVQGNTVTWVAGKFGSKALHITDADGFVQVPFSDSLNVYNQTDFSLATWVAITDDPASAEHILFHQFDLNGTGRVWLASDAAAPNDMFSYFAGQRTSSGFTLTPNVWTHVAIVVTELGDTDNVQIYINGEPSGTAGQLSIENCEGDFLIGRHKNGSNPWLGDIDDMVIARKAFSEEDLKDLMNNGLAQVLAVQPSGKLSTAWGIIKTGF